MSGMMDGNIIYTESYRNTVLSSWLDVNTATMPPVYTMSNQVFFDTFERQYIRRDPFYQLHECQRYKRIY